MGSRSCKPACHRSLPAGFARASCFPGRGLQRSKKINEVLLFCRAQRVEAVDYGVRFRMEFSTITGVVLDRHEQVCRSAIVQEEHALTMRRAGSRWKDRIHFLSVVRVYDKERSPRDQKPGGRY